MLRHLLHDLEWGIGFVIMTLIFFLIIALFTIKPAIATITETDIAPGHTHCRSEQVLNDKAGHKWEVLLFTQVNSAQDTSLNLRLSGISSSLKIQPQKPLIISTDSDHHYEVSNIFLGKSPLPSIGQYNLKKILPQLPTESVLLEIPLENGKLTHLQIPKTIVKEWQEVAAKNPDGSQKLPADFQLVC